LKDGDDETQYFVHYSYIDMSGYKTLKPGQAVTFEITDTEKGTQAHDVTPIN
jgi:CspA family cold shock protein